jgi:MFS family permease
VVQVLLLALAASAGVFAHYTLGPLQEAARVDLGLSDNQIAWLQGPALSLPAVIASIPIGLLIDRRSRVRLILTAGMLSVGGCVLTAVASHFAVLFVARFLVGLASMVPVMAAISLIADLYTPAARGRATMLIGVGQIGGSSGAFALGGALLAMLGNATANWRAALLWMTGVLLLVVLTSIALREPPRVGATAKTTSATPEAFAALWSHRAAITPLLIAKIMVSVADGAALIWAAPVLMRGFGLPPERVGAVLATVLVVSGLVGPICGGVLADLCQRTGGPRRTMLALSGLAILSLPASVFAVTSAVTVAGVLLVVFMTAGFTIGVMATTLFTIVVPGESRGLCLSISYGLGALFGAALAPVLVSALAGMLGGPDRLGTALMLVCVTSSFLGAVIFALGSRMVKQ